MTMGDADMCECCGSERYILAGQKFHADGKYYMARTVFIRERNKIITDLNTWNEEEGIWSIYLSIDPMKVARIKYCPLCGQLLDETGEGDWGD